MTKQVDRYLHCPICQSGNIYQPDYDENEVACEFCSWEGHPSELVKVFIEPRQA